MSLRLAIAFVAVAAALAGCASDMAQVRDECRTKVASDNADVAFDARLKLVDKCVDDNMSGRFAY
jgi:hypothetical protein